MIPEQRVVQVSAWHGWLVEVTLENSKTTGKQGYRCRIVDRNLHVFSDGETYKTSSAAMAAGRHYVEGHR